MRGIVQNHMFLHAYLSIAPMQIGTNRRASLELPKIIYLTFKELYECHVGRKLQLVVTQANPPRSGQGGQSNNTKGNPIK